MAATPMTQPRTLPRYRCHKEVWALKIKEISPLQDGSLMITPAEEGFGPFVVHSQYVPKHRDGIPAPGWYWVRYSNDYESFSPAPVFEEGYTQV